MLRQAIESVLAQTYRPIEIIVVDDGSTDSTVQMIEALTQQHPELRVLRRANGGPGLARETGRCAARGEFIQYLDSDDLLLPRKFEVQVTGLRANPRCGASYGKTRCYYVGQSPSGAPMRRTGEHIPAMFPAHLQSRWWSTSTPLYRRTVVDRAGPWTALRNEEDWEYDCRIASLGTLLHNSSEFVSDRRLHHEDSLSHNGSTDPQKLAERAIAHELILDHARGAGIAPDASEMQHFARELFLLSRQCGAAGLHTESERLFELARDASGSVRSQGWDFRLYGAAARSIGWTTVGKLACRLDALRP
jgi:glycosyltransferase involved in cell wall biosynthesis